MRLSNVGLQTSTVLLVFVLSLLSTFGPYTSMSQISVRGLFVDMTSSQAGNLRVSKVVDFWEDALFLVGAEGRKVYIKLPVCPRYD